MPIHYHHARIALSTLALFLPAAANAQLLQTPTSRVDFPAGGPAALGGSSTVSIPKFNVPSGTLSSIQLFLFSTLTGTFRVENLDNTSVIAGFNLSGTYVLSKPDTTAILTANSGGIGNGGSAVALAAFDGVVDFAGTSGWIASDRISNGSASLTITDPSEFALFTGSGTVNLTLTSTGGSQVSLVSPNGSFDHPAASVISVLGNGNVQVYYQYTAPVPEPEEYAAVVGLALVGFAAWRRRAVRR
jgi:hypothetical protein